MCHEWEGDKRIVKSQPCPTSLAWFEQKNPLVDETVIEQVVRFQTYQNYHKNNYI
jgi:hypothetical protein